MFWLQRMTAVATITWVLESEVFPESHGPLRLAILDRGHAIIEWNDEWWFAGIPTKLPTSRVIFHGSLGNASLIADRLNWSPGSFCPTNAFRCSSWYESARQWLVHSHWYFATADELVENAASIGAAIGSPTAFFVRPDSPLKPFSGRVVDVEGLTLSALDYGFYFDDASLPVVAAPLREIGDEWRFVIVADTVVSGSAYDPTTRSPRPADPGSTATKFASQIAANINAPADVYVLDVCECDGDLRLLELNPFGGADLYASDALAIVDAVSKLVLDG
ncbi:MAG: ATP-grasp domain-containing protein [Pirellulaceae bacterium]